MSLKPNTDRLVHEQRRARRPNSNKQLRRSKDSLIAGIAGGVATYLDVNPVLIRIVIAVAAIASLGIVVLPYLIFWMMIPKET